MHQGCLNVASSLDWGSVPEWVAGAVTAGAFALAAQTYRLNSRSAHQAQARKVYGVLEPDSMQMWTNGTAFTGVRLPDKQVASTEALPADVATSAGVATEDFWTGVLEVSNGSDEVITNVTAFVSDSSDQHKLIGFGSIENDTLRPAEVVYKLVVFTTDEMASCLPNREVVVHFKDSAGVDWRRIENHPIEKHAPYPL